VLIQTVYYFLAFGLRLHGLLGWHGLQKMRLLFFDLTALYFVPH
jgi:hypothetical protein